MCVVQESGFNFNPLSVFRMSYKVCGKVYRVHFVCCYRMLNANFLRKFQLLAQSEAMLISKDEHF